MQGHGPAILSCCRLSPGEKEADIAGHAPRIVEHLSPQVETERAQVIAPEFVAGARPALQARVPIRVRIVDPPSMIAAQRVREAVDLNLVLSTLGSPVDQLHD